MKKIAFIIISLQNGGAERVVANIANEYVAEKKCQFYLITGPRKKQDYNLNEQVDRKCILTGKLLEDVVRLRKFLQQKKIDCAVGIDLYANWCVCLANYRINTKMIISERNAPKQNLISRKSKLIIKLTYWRADGYVFQTNQAKECYSKSIQRRGTVIHNPVKPNLPTKTNIDSRRIVAVGRLNPQKNYPMLLRAFSQISKEFPDYTLEIYGQGELQEYILKLIKKLELDKKVTLCGYCLDVHEKIKDAEIFVMSSDCEGMPNSLMEAMAIGLPVICTDCPAGGPAELIKNGVNGLLTPVGDSEKMAQNIQVLIEDGQFREKLGKEAMKIRKTHSIENIVKQWDEILL